ncbi:hypothetical protein CBER1_10129 [Cercospora berteroae]|uniref:Uncharacterized protein n=1 Tax=Cercospora berteroae TaxID=357750 RepID=A0A2S6CKE2_9PEZI|nr:hypothetical protein CBER1_10129 [Cercospora berteroae]
MADAQDDSLELRERLESLPQELYDYIYKLTFTADSRVRCIARKGQKETARSIPRSFGPRNGLSADFDTKPYPQDPLFSVDRASRKLYAASYFNSVAVWSPSSIWPGVGPLAELHMFLHNLPREFRPLISTIRTHVRRDRLDAPDYFHQHYWPREKKIVKQRWGAEVADKLVWIYQGGEKMYY